MSIISKVLMTGTKRERINGNFEIDGKGSGTKRGTGTYRCERKVETLITQESINTTREIGPIFERAKERGVRLRLGGNWKRGLV